LTILTFEKHQRHPAPPYKGHQITLNLFCGVLKQFRAFWWRANWIFDDFS